MQQGIAWRVKSSFDSLEIEYAATNSANPQRLVRHTSAFPIFEQQFPLAIYKNNCHIQNNFPDLKKLLDATMEGM